MAKIFRLKRRASESDDPGDQNAWVAPSVRVFTEWDPQKIRAAITSAESGNLSLAVACCEWLFTDDRLDAVLDARIDELLGLTPTFEASGDGRRRNVAVKALEAGEDWWASFPEHELRLMLRWGLLLGLSLHRLAWWRREDHGNRVLPEMTFWHPQTLRFEHSTQKWFVRDHQHVEHEVVPGDGEWLMHTPFGRIRPWAQGKWRSASRWVLVKHYAVLDWSRHSEKASTLVATSSKDNTDKQRKQLAEDLQESGSDRVIALQLGFDLKMVEVSANTRHIYQAQIEAADKALAIIFRGGNLTTQAGDKGGSHAATKEQSKRGEVPKLRFDAETTTTTLHGQALVWWADYNYGDRKLAPWPSYPVEPEEDLQASATTVNTLADGVTKLDALGFEIDDKALSERFRLDFVKGRKSPEERAAERETLNPMPAAPAPGKGGAPAPGKTPAKDAPKKAEAFSGGQLLLQLASGDAATSAPNFIAGQLYVDEVVKSAAAAAEIALDDVHAGILEEVEACTSIPDFVDRMRARFRTMDQSAVQEITYRVMLLCELAGRYAVQQDN